MEIHANELIDRMLAAVKCLPQKSKAKAILTLLSQDIRHAVTLMENTIAAKDREATDYKKEISRVSIERGEYASRCRDLQEQLDALKRENLDATDPMITAQLCMSPVQQHKADFANTSGWGKIPPIKALREKTGLGLADAKNAVESMMNGNTKVYQIRHSALTSEDFNRYFTVTRKE